MVHRYAGRPAATLTTLLLLLVSALVAVPAGATAPLHPEPGNYVGVDAHGQWVTFRVERGVVHGFGAAHGLVHTIHLAPDGRWQRTCSHHVCVRGHWTSPTHAEGSWKSEDTDWLHWTVDDGDIVPATGLYVGVVRDLQHRPVEFHFRHWAVHDFFGPVHFGAAAVDRDEVNFHHCSETRCVQARWESAYRVAGIWRAVGDSHWHHWWAGYVLEPDDGSRG